MLMGSPKQTKIQKKCADFENKWQKQQQENTILLAAVDDARKINEENQNYKGLFSMLVEKNVIDGNGNLLGDKMDYEQTSNEASLNITAQTHIQKWDTHVDYGDASNSYEKHCNVLILKFYNSSTKDITVEMTLSIDSG